MIPIELGLETDHQHGWAVLRAKGDVDLFSAPDLRTAIYDLIEAGDTRIAVELSGVAFLDSTGLGVLVGALKRLRERSGRMILVSPQKPVSRVLSVTGLDKIFTVQAEFEPDGILDENGAESAIDATTSQ